MRKKRSVFLVLSLLVFASLITVSAATINEMVNNEDNAQKQIVAFSDIKESDWYYDDVKYVQENKLMTGTSETEFSPSGDATRGMIVTILWRVEGEPVVEGKDFEDVGSDAWYSKAVAWASKNQIVSGYNETEFGPNDTATREQFATIMYRYASFKKLDISKSVELDKYSDKEQISEYAVKSMQWANANGIISGTSDETISPKDNVQRCQVAAILRRFCENYKVFENNKINGAEDEEEEANKNEELEENEDTDKNTDSSGESTGNSQSGSSGNTSDTESSEPIPPSDLEEEIVENIIAKNASIKLKTTYGKAGDTIPVVVELRENPGILGAILTLEYDESAMTLVDVENGEAVADVLTLTHSKEFASGMNFVWDGLELDSSDIKEGTMLVLYFELSSDAMPGKRYPLKLDYKPGSVIDEDLNKVNLMISQGFIEIEEQNNN